MDPNNVPPAIAEAIEKVDGFARVGRGSLGLDIALDFRIFSVDARPMIAWEFLS